MRHKNCATTARGPSRGLLFSVLRGESSVFIAKKHRLHKRVIAAETMGETPRILRRTGYMKATGIVRRIDDLGRVVIPKEIRRTLRIREGDPLEIYTEKDGEVIFKKYSPMGELSGFAGQICESLFKATGTITAVCDRDSVIAVSGGGRRELLEKPISHDLEQIMENRRVFHPEDGEKAPLLVSGEDRYNVAVAAPILSEGDVLGCMVFVTLVGSPPAGDLERKLAQTVAGFLGRQMEG